MPLPCHAPNTSAPARRQSPSESFPLADDLAGAAIGALDIVEMDFADRAVFEAQKQRRGVFGVDFELAQFTGQTDHVGDPPKSQRNIVDLVNRIENDAAAELRRAL